MSSSDSPAILNVSLSPAILNASDLNDSFKSVSNDNSLVIPMTGLDDSPVLSGHPNACTLWKKRLVAFILLLLLGGCIVAIIHLSIKVEWMASLVGNYSLTVPAVGNFNGSFEIKEEGEVSLSGKLASLKPSSVLWDQTYMDLQMS